MKEQKKTKRTIAAILVGIFLMMMVPLPVTAFAEGEGAEAVLVTESAPEAAPPESAPVSTESVPAASSGFSDYSSAEPSGSEGASSAEASGSDEPSSDVPSDCGYSSSAEPSDSEGSSSAESSGSDELSSDVPSDSGDSSSAEPSDSEGASLDESSDSDESSPAKSSESGESEPKESSDSEVSEPAATSAAEENSETTGTVQTLEAPAASDVKEKDVTAVLPTEGESGKTETAAVGGFTFLSTEAEEALSGGQTVENEKHNKAETQFGDHIFTVYGSFPEGTELQVVEIPRDLAAQMAGKAALFAYDIRLVVDGQIWQPEEHGTNVQVSMRSLNGDLDNVAVDLLHVKTNLIDDAGILSEDALKEALQNMTDGSAESEMLDTEAGENGFSFDTSSFSPYVGTTNSQVVYVYNSTLFKDDSANYAGVYSTLIRKNSLTAEQAKTEATIGIQSIADKNLENAPTTESPAIIQGAAVGYENRLSPTEYTLIDPDRPRPEPYSEFTVKIMEEQGADGTVHKKPSGFDGTYVIVRLDVSEFLSSGEDNLYLHVQQKDNKALMPAATVAKGTANAKVEDYKPVNVFTDGLGNRSASYKLSDLVDANDQTKTPYVDIILYATAANVAGADTTSTVQGDVPLALYVDKQLQYNDELKEYDPNNEANVDPNAKADDPNAKTAEKYTAAWHAKFFDESKAKTISHYVVKGSDLALETMVEKSGGTNNDETTYWSLKKSMENSYYDQEIDQDPNNPGCGKTVKLMSEVAVTNGLTLEGSSANSLKKRTLDVNSYDIQVANNSGVEGKSAEDITLKNAWLTIADYSNTTGAEMAIGNNAQFVIDQGGKLIIDETCQLEIEWDGATTTPGTTGQETQPSILNNGQLDLRAGGEIVNNGIITIEGTEGKPLQPETSQQAIDSEKGRGEMTVREGATLTNNGALVIYGALSNRGTLVNNGRYNDVIKSNDPDKGLFDYHKGIQVAWKDDVTQKNIEAGSLTNEEGATLINNGDIVLVPGTLENKGLLVNASGANIYSAAATEAIIPITPDPATPTVVTKRVTLNPVKLSNCINSGTLINNGNIAPATVALLDNTGGFDKLTSPGAHPELFSVRNSGVIYNNGYIYNQYNGNIVNTGIIYGSENTSETGLLAALVGSIHTENDLWLYLYEDGTFLMILPNGERLTGTFAVTEGLLIFISADGTRMEPEVDEEGNSAYSIATKSGFTIEFVLTVDFLANVQAALEAQR